METDANDRNPTTYIFFNGARIARIDPGTTTAKYYVTDNIGSTEVETDDQGNPLNQSLFFPYGVERIIQQYDTANNYRFSGKERDPNTGLDDFGARFYASTLGRFMTPDWDAKPAAVPYASYGDPQTLNLYSYVKNGPLNRVDADGHVDQIQRSVTVLSSLPPGQSNSDGHPNPVQVTDPEQNYVTEQVALTDQAAASTGNAAAGDAQDQAEEQQTQAQQTNINSSKQDQSGQNNGRTTNTANSDNNVEIAQNNPPSADPQKVAAKARVNAPGAETPDPPLREVPGRSVIPPMPKPGELPPLPPNATLQQKLAQITALIMKLQQQVINPSGAPDGLPPMFIPYKPVAPKVHCLQTKDGCIF